MKKRLPLLFDRCAVVDLIEILIGIGIGHLKQATVIIIAIGGRLPLSSSQLDHVSDGGLRSMGHWPFRLSHHTHCRHVAWL